MSDLTRLRDHANEIDDYLAPQPDLFGEMTAEPTTAAHTTEPEEAS